MFTLFQQKPTYREIKTQLKAAMRRRKCNKLRAAKRRNRGNQFTRGGRPC